MRGRGKRGVWREEWEEGKGGLLVTQQDTAAVPSEQVGYSATDADNAALHASI